MAASSWGTTAIGAGSDTVEVYRQDAGTWGVHSQAGAHLALCENTGELYHVTVHFVISTP